MTYITASGVIKVYRSGDLEVTALRGVDIAVERGEFVLILGPSGSGKTTLLNLLGGLDRPTAGRVSVDGFRLDSATNADLAKYRRTEVGFVFQFFNLIPSLTARENVEFPMVLLKVPRDKRKARSEQLLVDMGLGDRLNQYPHQMSGGEQQRVAIAVALANDPPLLLADEPTGELDSAGGQKVLELMRTLRDKREKTILAVSHDARMERFADRVWLIEDGALKPHPPE